MHHDAVSEFAKIAGGYPARASCKEGVERTFLDTVCTRKHS